MREAAPGGAEAMARGGFQNDRSALDRPRDSCSHLSRRTRTSRGSLRESFASKHAGWSSAFSFAARLSRLVLLL